MPSSTAYFYATELSLRSLRCFGEARLDLRYPGEDNKLTLPNVNLLLGDNGTGKSTVLRAIAMAALGKYLENSGFSSFHYVRQGRKKAQIDCSFLFNGIDGPAPLSSRVTLIPEGDIETVESATHGAYWRDIFTESTPSFFVVGYGTNRRVSDDAKTDPSLERGRRRRRYQRVSSLFDDSISLTPLGAWLPLASSSVKSDVDELLQLLLPQGVKFTGNFEGSEPVFGRLGVKVPLRAMSDGFRSYIGWLSDLLYQLSAAAPGLRLRDVGGIVLVDEVDLLLHPSWQRIVVPAISRAFPNMQFIFTTHSPIVTGTLQAGNIVVCREERNKRMSVLKRIEAEVHGLNSEQVLLSSYFDLGTTRSPDALPVLAELERRAIEGDADATREYLRALSTGDFMTEHRPEH
jgi:hypothetical protein